MRLEELGTSTIKFRIGMTDIVKFACSKDFKEQLCIGKNKKLNLILLVHLHLTSGMVIY